MELPVTGGAWEWQIAVFCQNERRSIAACLRSISAAVGSRRALITVIVNGSSDGSEKVAHEAIASIATPVQIFRIVYGDKAHAINSFFYDRSIRVDAELYFCVDAYVRLYPDALEEMAKSLAQHQVAVAATGIATTGRSEPKAHRATLKTGGALHGQFYALRSTFVNRIASCGIRLPIGVYWGDGLLGSMAAHDLDPLHRPWVNERVITVGTARFETNPLSPFRLRDIRRQFRRKIRQMRGKVQNAAIKTVIYRGGYSALPVFADDLIRDFLASNPAPAVSWPNRFFMEIALRQYRPAQRPNGDHLKPIRIA